jgi:hypothetical protein
MSHGFFDDCLLYILAACIVLILLIATGNLCPEHKNASVDAEQLVQQKLSNYWQCMDGCYFMLEVEYGTGLKYNNASLKRLHDLCAEKCWAEKVSN